MCLGTCSSETGAAERSREKPAGPYEGQGEASPDQGKLCRICYDQKATKLAKPSPE